MANNASVDPPDNGPIKLAAEIISAYVGKNVLPSKELPALIFGVHAALSGIGKAPSSPDEEKIEIKKPTPAQIRKSVTPDALISFIDGKPYKTLKRHLAVHGLTPHAYCERYGLPADYPTTAPNYSAQRSAMAKGFGLGQRRAG
ncbi:MucR family transcriptional regulator [Methylorubrum extorquens]|uniref:MucR family transcriptional regulator n=1 Tax=Methylorubrum extorquens TaxID=408 RepID=A0AAX3WM53_METEX|nr:MucR family transcriptional regulator [Methylorubrum extorquens]WHQ72547.1 MucR family transcriptional regulator [Methylorubrum extorquens]